MRSIYLFLLLLFGGLHSVFAQGLCNNISIQGGFTPTTDKTCLVGGTVTIGVIDQSGSTNPVNYVFDYKGESANQLANLASNTSNSTYAYTQAGTYTILQYGTKGGAMYACKQVTIVETKDFDVNLTTCADSKEVFINILPNTTGYDAYKIQWDATNASTATTIGKYNQPYPNGLPTKIDIHGQIKSSAGTVSCTYLKSLIPVISKPKILKLEMPQADQALVSFQDNTNGKYTLLYRPQNSNTWITSTQTPTKISGSDYSVNALNLNSTQAHCFKIRVENDCTNPTESEEVCGILLSAVQAGNQNNVSWTSPPNANTFTFERKEGNSAATSTPSTSTTYTDFALSCGKDICYLIKANINETEIISNQKCVVGSGNNASPALEVFNANIIKATNSVELMAIDAEPKTKYIFLRSDTPNGAFTQIGAAGISRFVDKTANINQQPYCYQIRYEDACGNFSKPSASVCTIHTKIDDTGKVTWSSYETPLNVVAYAISYLLPDGSDFTMTINDINNRTFNIIDVLPKGTLEATICIEGSTAPEPKFGITLRSLSNAVKYTAPVKVYFPSAFAPNGVNSSFMVKGTVDLLTDFKMLIYNAWGEIIFESSDPKIGWDGNYNGQPAPAGTYAYRLTATDPFGKMIQKVGTVLLIR